MSLGIIQQGTYAPTTSGYMQIFGGQTSTTSTITTSSNTIFTTAGTGNSNYSYYGTDVSNSKAYSPPELSQWELERLVRDKGGIPIWRKGAGSKVPRLVVLSPQEEKENRELRKKGLPAKHKPGIRFLPPLKDALAYELPRAATYPMPDGSLLRIGDTGNYRIEDKNAKVTYKANRLREFNPYINASDLLEAFIGDAGKLTGVDQDQVLALPIEMFINWLIRRAAERDEDSLEGLPTVESALPALPNPNKSAGVPRCVACGRYIKRAWAAAQIAFCSPQHMQLQLERLA